MWQKIKLILKSVRQYKKYALITPLFMIGEALLECLMPFTMSMLIDSVSDAVNPNLHPTGVLLTQFSDIVKPIPYTNANLGINWNVSILALILTLVGMALVSLLCGIWGGKYAAKASVGGPTYTKDTNDFFSNFSKTAF